MRALVLDLHDRRQHAVAAVGLSFVRIKALHQLVDGPLPMRELAARLGVDRPYVTVISDDLEARGLVTRGPHPSDRRAKLLSITPAGREIDARAGQVLNEPPAALVALPEEQLRLLNEVLDRLVAAAEAPAISRPPASRTAAHRPHRHSGRRPSRRRRTR
jgi:DNA-binding MarR family transcriptional regulator